MYTRARAEKSARFLDAQAALPAGERDYAGAAGIAGYGRREFEALDARGQQAARREIDRELAVRKGANVAAREVAAGGEGSLKRREQQKVEKQFGQTLEQEVKAEGHELPHRSNRGRNARVSMLSCRTGEQPGDRTAIAPCARRARRRRA